MNWDTRLIDSIIKKIGDNRIVPIIGSGAFFIHETTGNISVQEYVVRELLGIDDIGLALTEDNKKNFCCGYRGMTNIDRLCDELDVELYNEVSSIFNSESFKDKLTMNPKVREFLDLGGFPLVITTCVFHGIESLIPRYNNAKDEYYIYQMDGVQEQGVPKNVLKGYCLYYLFGLVDDYTEAVITERDLLKYLYFIQDSGSRPKNLQENLNPWNSEESGATNKKRDEKYLLSIGCDVPDWAFRFLIYSLKEQKGELKYRRRKSHDFKGGVFSQNIDNHLDEFLSDIGYLAECDLDSLLEEINKRLPRKCKPSLFLSVNSEDYKETGDYLYDLLKEEFDVWYYPKNGGGEYWKRINDGILKCQYFMPVITNASIPKIKSKNEVKEPDKEIGVLTELRMALKRKNELDRLFCVPYVIETTVENLNLELKEDTCPNHDLFELFFGPKACEAITTKKENLSAREVLNYIKNAQN